MATDSTPQDTAKNGETKVELDESKSSVKGLLGSWEQRASTAIGVPDVARYAGSKKVPVVDRSSTYESPARTSRKKVAKAPPETDTGKKSTRQAIEDLSLFVSPRVVKEKLHVKPKQKTSEPSETTPPKEGRQSDPPIPTSPKATLPLSPFDISPMVTPTGDTTPRPPTRKASSRENKQDGRDKAGSIRDRMRAFQKTGDNGGGPPWMQQPPLGKRSSAVDLFTPRKPSLVLDVSDDKQKDLPEISLEADDETPKLAEEEQPTPTPPESSTTGPSSGTLAEANPTPESDAKEKKPSKIDRDKLVSDEIDKMIRDAEDREIEDEMDEEVKDCLRQAALKSPAYTRRWYDVLTDSFLHCPSLATLIMDFSLIELAEELYEDELPMLYTVSLRAIAAEVALGEEELPEYVLRLAS